MNFVIDLHGPSGDVAELLQNFEQSLLYVSSSRPPQTHAYWAFVQEEMVGTRRLEDSELCIDGYRPMVAEYSMILSIEAEPLIAEASVRGVESCAPSYGEIDDEGGPSSWRRGSVFDAYRAAMFLDDLSADPKTEPVPESRLVEKNGSKMRCRFSLCMPWPPSVKAT